MAQVKIQKYTKISLTSSVHLSCLNERPWVGLIAYHFVFLDFWHQICDIVLSFYVCSLGLPQKKKRFDVSGEIHMDKYINLDFTLTVVLHVNRFFVWFLLWDSFCVQWGKWGITDSLERPCLHCSLFGYKLQEVLLQLCLGSKPLLNQLSLITLCRCFLEKESEEWGWVTNERNKHTHTHTLQVAMILFDGDYDTLLKWNYMWICFKRAMKICMRQVLASFKH